MAKKDDDIKLDELLTEAAAPPSSELTEKEKLELEAEAAVEVAKELKAANRKAFKDAAKQRLKKQKLFQAGKDETGDDTQLILVNLGPCAGYVRLDNEVYHHGRAYRLGKGKAQVLLDQMHRTWLHENEIQGKNMNEFYGRQKANSVIGPSSTY